MNLTTIKPQCVSTWSGWSIVEAIQRISGEHAPLTHQECSLWSNLSEAKLVATGVVHDQIGPTEVLDPGLFPNVDWSEQNPDVLSMTNNGGVLEIRDLRIFPVLRAPNVADFLHELPISHAFKNYVIGDPEVIRLCTSANGNSRVRLMVSDAEVPGALGGLRWPIDVTSEGLAFRFVDPGIYLVGDRTPDPPATIAALSSVIADRIAAFREHLVAGTVEATGTSERSGLEGPIGRLQWARNGISIDVQSGDLCEGQDHLAVPKYTGIILRRPMSVSAQVRDAQPMTVGTSRKAEIRGQTTEKSKQECIDLFCGLMRASPKKRTHSKENLKKMARERWDPKTLSDNAIDEARKEAIRSTGARAWTYAGAPERSSPG